MLPHTALATRVICGSDLFIITKVANNTLLSVSHAASGESDDRTAAKENIF